MEEYKLDNPIWYSLSETHHAYSINSGDTKFYHPDYCPFGGFVNTNGLVEAIENYSKLTNDFFVVGEKPEFPPSLKLKNELVCNQMIITKKIEMEFTLDIIGLMDKHAKELFELVNLVQPGYFRNKTAQLGDYFGVLSEGKLVAVSGERMQMSDAIEVSAVVTHPDHQGKGFASQLTAITVNRIFQKGKTPFLHVAETNSKAISLYQKLGFSIRRKISFWHLVTS